MYCNTLLDVVKILEVMKANIGFRSGHSYKAGMIDVVQVYTFYVWSLLDTDDELF